MSDTTTSSTSPMASEAHACSAVLNSNGADLPTSVVTPDQQDQLDASIQANADPDSTIILSTSISSSACSETPTSQSGKNSSNICEHVSVDHNDQTEKFPCCANAYVLGALAQVAQPDFGPSHPRDECTVNFARTLVNATDVIVKRIPSHVLFSEESDDGTCDDSLAQVGSWYVPCVQRSPMEYSRDILVECFDL